LFNGKGRLEKTSFTFDKKAQMFAVSFLSAAVFVFCPLPHEKSENLLFIFAMGVMINIPQRLVPFPSTLLPFMNVLLAITIFKLRKKEGKRRVEIKLIIV
jgi:hypothetical protein